MAIRVLQWYPMFSRLDFIFEYAIQSIGDQYQDRATTLRARSRSTDWWSKKIPLLLRFPQLVNVENTDRCLVSIPYQRSDAHPQSLASASDIYRLPPPGYYKLLFLSEAP